MKEEKWYSRLEWEERTETWAVGGMEESKGLKRKEIENKKRKKKERKREREKGRKIGYK